jgi:hypothetical protein
MDDDQSTVNEEVELKEEDEIEEDEKLDLGDEEDPYAAADQDEEQIYMSALLHQDEEEPAW